MLKHIVLFAFKEFSTPKALDKHLLDVKRELEALCPLIDEIRAINVHIGCNPIEPYHIMLAVDVDDLSALERYAKHPAHQRVVQQWITPFLEKRAAIDYCSQDVPKNKV